MEWPACLTGRTRAHRAATTVTSPAAVGEDGRTGGHRAAGATALALLALISTALLVVPARALAAYSFRKPVNISRSATRESVLPAVAATADGTVHAVWEDFMTYTSTGTLDDIFYNAGRDDAWGTPENISNDASDSAKAVLAVTGDRPNALWLDRAPGYYRTFWRPGGPAGWTTDASAVSKSGNPSDTVDVVAAPGGQLHAVWCETFTGGSSVEYSFFDGANWSTPSEVRRTPQTARFSAVTLDRSGAPCVAWSEGLGSGADIYFSRLGGASWSAPVNVFQRPGSSVAPDIATDASGRLHLVWKDRTTGNYEIWHKVLDDGRWALGRRLTSTRLESAHPKVSVDASDTVHVVWFENYGRRNYFGTRSDIFHLEKPAAGRWSARSNLSFNAPSSMYPDVAADAMGGVHVVWMDDSPGKFDIYYSRGSADTSAPSVSSARAYPRAFSPRRRQRTTIRFTVRDDISWNVRVKANIRNRRGKWVRTLGPRTFMAGARRLAWNGRSHTGRLVGPGVYRVRVRAYDMAGNVRLSRTVYVRVR